MGKTKRRKGKPIGHGHTKQYEGNGMRVKKVTPIEHQGRVTKKKEPEVDGAKPDLVIVDEAVSSAKEP